MELKLYLRMLMRKWWLMLPAFFITLGATAALTLRQQPVYEARATYVVRPTDRALVEEGMLSALETVSRRVEIGATYAEVADSNLIRERALETLDLSSEQRRGLTVSSQVRAGTNILVISVQGTDPEAVRDAANAIGAETVKYVTNLYDIFELEVLDRAGTPQSPIRPRVPLNLLIGGVLGAVLAVGMAFLAEYLQQPLQNEFSFNIMDPVAGVYNRDYFMLRLRQELSRSKRSNHSSSLALLQLHFERTEDIPSQRIRSEALRRVASLIEAHLREEDIVAQLDGGTFAILMPNMEGEAAREVVDRVRSLLNGGPLLLASFGSFTLNVHAVGSVTGLEMGDDAQALLAQALRGLEIARSITYGQVYLHQAGANGTSGDHKTERADEAEEQRKANGHARARRAEKRADARE